MKNYNSIQSIHFFSKNNTNNILINKYYLSFFIFITLISSLFMCVFSINWTFNFLPNINQGCTSYNCSWIVDIKSSYCYNGTCHYYYLAVINNISSWWPWHTPGECYHNCSITENSTSWWQSNNTNIQPYPNNTLCYKPIYCKTYTNKWIQGYNCQPIFSCINTLRITIKYVYIILSIIFISVLYIFLFIIFLKWHFNLTYNNVLNEIYYI